MSALISQRSAEPSGLRREEVYAKLRQDILSCALPPGAGLFEGVLAERFEVSKSPIRDALSRLHAERLVTVAPRKGYRVAPISLTDAVDLFGLRITLEASCALLSAERADGGALADLDRFRDFDASADVAVFVAYNTDFHLSLVDLCPNRRMAETARTVIEQFDRINLMSMSFNGPRLHGPLVVEHNAVVDALQARDGRRARRLLVQHAARAEKRVMAALAQCAITA